MTLLTVFISAGLMAAFVTMAMAVVIGRARRVSRLEVGADRPRAGPRTPRPCARAPTGAFAGLTVALVHDEFRAAGDGDRVVEQLLAVVPHADLFALFDALPPGEARSFLGGRAVRTSFLQRLPLVRRYPRLSLPLVPLAAEQLDVSGYDLVISSGGLAAKGVLTGSDQLHVCYCHAPARPDLDGPRPRRRGARSLGGRLLLHYLRGWDGRSAQGVDLFLAASEPIARRIAKAYRRSATIVPPPPGDAGPLDRARSDQRFRDGVTDALARAWGDLQAGRQPADRPDATTQPRKRRSSPPVPNRPPVAVV